MTIDPLTACDYYKVGHAPMYPYGTTKVYSNQTPRKSRVEGVNKVVVSGLQYFVKEYLINTWNKNFFNKPWEHVAKKHLRKMDNTLGAGKVKLEQIKALHQLGYLPISIKALPEGALCPMRVPMFTITNTVDHAYWLVNYLETILSTTTWQSITSATIALEYRKLLNKFALETVGNTDFVQWQGHDFSFRGMSSYESACMSGFGHLLSFTGTDTIPAIDFAEEYYNADVEKELVGGSVFATEHAVASFNIIYGNAEYTFDAMLKEFIDRTPEGYEKAENIDPKLIKEYAFLKWYITIFAPNGVASYVGDTYNLFAVVAEILPRLKPEIMARNGGFPVDRLVIRPDSFWTDPVDCLCGFGGYHPQMEKLTPREKLVVKKGLIESLYDIFGGVVNKLGYKELDYHIGAIYGDSITLERCKNICLRLKDKG
ncbi:MAG: hypothetical protein EKK57_00015, partial [Proteobacteria bacterium]